MNRLLVSLASVGLFLFAGAIRAASPAAHVPAGAVLYIGSTGPLKSWPGYNHSHLKQFAAQAGLKQLFDDYIPHVLQAIDRKVPASQSETIWKDAATIARHPFAIYLDGLYQPAGAAPGSGPFPRIGLIVHTSGSSAQAVLKPLHLLAEISNAHADGQAPPLKAGISGHWAYLWFGNPNPHMRALLAGRKAGGQSLAENSGFQSASTQTGNGQVMMYVNIAAARGLLGKIANNAGNPGAAAKWYKVQAAFGLKNWSSFAAAARFVGADWQISAFIAKSAGTEPVAVASASGGIAALLAHTPAGVTWFNIRPVNLEAGFNLVRTLVSLSPGGAMQFESAVSRVNAILRLDVQKDLLQSFGTNWLCYQDDALGGQGTMGLVLVNHPIHPRRLANALFRIPQLATLILNSQSRARGTPLYLRVTQKNIDGIHVNYIAAPAVSPAWAFWKNSLYIGLYPQTVVAAIQAANAGTPDITSNPRFARLMQRLGNIVHPTSVSYSNLRKSAEQEYSSDLLMSRYCFGLADTFLSAPLAPPMAVPTLPTLKSDLDTAGTITWIDPAGEHFRSTEPFPGSETLTGSYVGSIFSPTSIGTESLIVAILLPSLARAKTLANRADSSANERSIVQASVIYAMSHNNKYPRNLATLIAQSLLTPRSLVVPGSGTTPAHLRTLTPAQRHSAAAIARLLKGHCDYVYVGKGLTGDAGPNDVVVYERPGINKGEGCNVGFGDAAASWYPARVLPQVFQVANTRRQADNLPPALYRTP